LDVSKHEVGLLRRTRAHARRPVWGERRNADACATQSDLAAAGFVFQSQGRESTKQSARASKAPQSPGSIPYLVSRPMSEDALKCHYGSAPLRTSLRLKQISSRSRMLQLVAEKGVVLREAGVETGEAEATTRSTTSTRPDSWGCPSRRPSSSQPPCTSPFGPRMEIELVERDLREYRMNLGPRFETQGKSRARGCCGLTGPATAPSALAV
jgi:hypothetical protein